MERHSFWALREVTLRVAPGEPVGVLGPNGSGKTTLLRIISGIYRPDAGVLRTRGHITTLIATGAGFRDELTGLDNVHLTAAIHGYARRDVELRLDSILDFAGLGDFVHEPVRAYSSGMRVRLGMAVALGFEPDILLVDDVLSSGDEAFQARALERMRSLIGAGTAAVVVSHDPELLKRLCPRAIFLSGGRVVQDGPLDDVIATSRAQSAARPGGR